MAIARRESPRRRLGRRQLSIRAGEATGAGTTPRRQAALPRDRAASMSPMFKIGASECLVLKPSYYKFKYNVLKPLPPQVRVRQAHRHLPQPSRRPREPELGRVQATDQRPECIHHGIRRSLTQGPESVASSGKQARDWQAITFSAVKSHSHNLIDPRVASLGQLLVPSTPQRFQLFRVSRVICKRVNP